MLVQRLLNRSFRHSTVFEGSDLVLEAYTVRVRGGSPFIIYNQGGVYASYFKKGTGDVPFKILESDFKYYEILKEEMDSETRNAYEKYYIWTQRNLKS